MVDKTREQVTVRNDSGMELERNTSFVKKYKEQDESSPVELFVGNGGDHADRDVEEKEDLEERTNVEQTTAATTLSLEVQWRRPSQLLC